MANAPTSELARLTANLKSEIDGAALYRCLAANAPSERQRDVLLELAESEDRHAARWRDKLREAGAEPPDYRPSLRVRLLCWIARRFGVKTVLPIAGLGEADVVDSYARQHDAQDFAREERSHARVFAEMARSPGAVDVARAEGWHRGSGGGSLRAAIFGVNDGLVSNLSLIMGVAGANPETQFVLLAGIAGLLAGAFSMAAGEYISMTAQRELFEHQLAIEREELESSPQEERAELALIYRAKGLNREDAERIANTLLADKEAALDTLAREELGLDPEELGSPIGAAASSFIAFAIGAIVPVLPFLFATGITAVVTSGFLGALALLIVGASLSLFTGRNPAISALRMLAVGLGAAAVTYLIGRAIGVSVT